MVSARFLFIDYDSDESFVVSADRVELGRFSHDEHGWAGMTAVKELVVEIAASFDIPLVQVGDPNV